MNAIHEDWKAAEVAALDWPAWANWRAMDADGRWYWHREKPIHLMSCWASGRQQLAPPQPLADDWRESLVRKPT